MIVKGSNYKEDGDESMKEVREKRIEERETERGTTRERVWVKHGSGYHFFPIGSATLV